MTFALFGLTFAAILLDWIAVARRWPAVEYFAKPAVMVFLFAWLYAATQLRGAPLWFGIGIVFSLIGDSLLLFPDRLFLPGLAAFLLAQTAYIIGFSAGMAAPNFWTVTLAAIIAFSAVRILRKLMASLKAGGHNQLILPVQVYGLIISLMLFTAMLTLTRPDWKPVAAALASLGALLFYISDIILAWNRFVAPIRNGRLLNMAAYHIGQAALIVGVAMQFAVIK